MTTTTHEAQPTHRAETPTLAGVPDGLQPADLDQLVGAYTDASEEISAEDKKARIDGVLRAHGFDPEAEDGQAREDYNFARGIYEMAMSANKAEWLGIPEGQQMNRRELTADAVAEWYEPRLIKDRYEGRHVATNDVETQPETSVDTQTGDDSSESERSEAESDAQPSEPNTDIADPEDVALTKEAMSEALDTYAQLIAVRSRSIVERAKTGQGIEDAGAELSDMIAALADNMYSDLEAEGFEKQAIIEKIDEFIDTVTNDTLAKVEEHRLAEYNNSRPYLQKMYDKWAEWSADNRKLTGGRLKKALVFAVPGAALGLALAPLVGAVGAGVLTGAAAMTGSRSIGRHLANGFMKKRDKRFAAAQTDEMQTEIEGIYAQNNEKAEARKAAQEAGTGNDRVLPRPEERNLDLIEFVNQRSREYRVRNRNRLLAGTAIAMSVGLLSSTAADALDGAVDAGKWAFGKLPDINNPLNDGNDTGDTPDVDTPEEQPVVPGDTLTPDDNLDWSDFSRDARFVEPGEGGFQTLKEMGIPESKWEAIWQDAGAKLHDEGKTYTMDDGRWGWDRSMRLSDHDLNVIAHAARRNGVDL